MTHPYLDWPGPLAFAHRGGASDFPENTLPAFRHAVDLGYTYLETDVHATADGVLVAFHDPDLQRTCNVPGRIDSLPWSEVAQARVAGTEPIPRFVDLLDEFPHARINVDCKEESGVAPLVELLRSRPELRRRLLVGSFDDRRSQRIRAAVGADLLTNLGTRRVAALRFTGRFPASGGAAQVPVRVGKLTVVTPRFIAAAHTRGIHVHVWTIDEPDEMHRLLDLGVDGIMTDRPTVLKQVLVERGSWVEP
mgnify:FL=1